jgi:molybdate transport system substrate-binding protein
VLGVALALAPMMRPAKAEDRIMVFAAASLTDSLQAVADAYRAEKGEAVALSFAASNTLARQIGEGAEADIFLSADENWMDFLARQGRIDPATRKDLLGNRLVLIGGREARPITIAPGFPLAAALGDGRLAMADPDAVPAGIYGKAALVSLGVWHSLSGKIAAAENVRAALQFVSRGEAPYGIVYWTDAKADPGVRIVATFPESSHPAIVYPVALTKRAGPGAKDFLRFLWGPQASAIFRKAGFTVLD